MAKKTTLPHRRLIQFDDAMLNKINDFRFSQRIGTESEAIRELIRRGLAWTIRHPQTTSASVAKRLTEAADSNQHELEYVTDEQQERASPGRKR